MSGIAALLTGWAAVIRARREVADELGEKLRACEDSLLKAWDEADAAIAVARRYRRFRRGPDEVADL